MKSKLELINDKQTLQIEKMNLDRFFSLYLDKFGSKMDPEKPNTKIWALYKTKLKEYDEVSQKIKHLEYWISK
jgi:hypothetical protein